MKTALLYVIRDEIIKGRQKTWSQKGELLLGKGSFLPFRLLQPPSSPFHYTALRLVDSGTWRSQTLHEFLTQHDDHLWTGSISFHIRDYRNTEIVEAVRQFIFLAHQKIPDLFLDFEYKFWDKHWSEWLLTYEVDPLRAFGTRIKQYIGKGVVWYKGQPACTITTMGNTTQP